MRTTNKRPALCMAIGGLLLAVSLGLTVYNVLDNRRANLAAQALADQLEAAILQQTQDADQTPDYILHPEMDMPVMVVDGYGYVGTLEMPALGIRLPVMSDWDYPRLRLAPCRYAGSAYLGNFVIAAHNYTHHFGTLRNLKTGDRVVFTDSDGNVFRYQVTEVEILAPYDVDGMISSDWDLTLFTCTVGGKSRVTVRCELCP